jgi:hypothetical protein
MVVAILVVVGRWVVGNGKPVLDRVPLDNYNPVFKVNRTITTPAITMSGVNIPDQWVVARWALGMILLLEIIVITCRAP